MNSAPNPRLLLSALPALLLLAALPGQAPYFTSPSPITELSDPNFDERCPTTTEDELQIVFSSDRGPGGDYELLGSRRPHVGATWGPPQALLALNTPDDELMPCLSYDGLALYFVRASGNTRAIFVSRRPALGAPWPAPSALPGPINGPGIANGYPRPTKDERTLFFVRENGAGVSRILMSQRIGAGAPFGAPVPFAPAAGVPGNHVSPIPMANGEKLWLGSRPPGQNTVDWFVMHHDAAGWSAPRAVPELDATPTGEAAGDGVTGRLYQAAEGANGKFDLEIRCRVPDTLTLQACVDLDLVPVWCPILMTYIYQNVWEWQIGTVATFKTFDWDSGAPTPVAFLVSTGSLNPPLMVAGIEGALVVDPTSMALLTSFLPAPNGLGTLPVTLPNNPGLSGLALHMQTIRFSAAIGKWKLSEPIQMRVN